MPLSTRLAYWLPLMMAGAFLGHAMSALIARAPRINQNKAVESTRREGERLVLVLKGGAEAPVSRPNMRPLREAGWF